MAQYKHLALQLQKALWHLSGSSDSIVKLDIIGIDVLIIAASGAAIHDQLCHLCLARQTHILSLSSPHIK